MDITFLSLIIHCINTPFIKLIQQGKIPLFTQYGIRAIFAPIPASFCISTFSLRLRSISMADTVEIEETVSMENQTSNNGSWSDLIAAANSQIDAQLNPYFIHHSLGPTTAIVMQPLALTGAINCTSCSRAMLMAISGRNKACFITRKIRKPLGKVLLDAWICNYDIIASWILNSISKEIALLIFSSIVYTGSVKEIWNELCQIFKQPNGPSIYQLLKRICHLAARKLDNPERTTQNSKPYGTTWMNITQQMDALVEVWNLSLLILNPNTSWPS